MPCETLCRSSRHDGRKKQAPKPAATELSQGQLFVRWTMAGLAQCAKTGALAAAIVVAFCMGAHAQDALSANEIRTRIIGHSFQGRKGIMSVSLRYAEDGTVSMRTPIGSGAGTWALSDDRLCVKIVTGPRKMDDCLSFTGQPDGTYRASNGLRLTPEE